MFTNLLIVHTVDTVIQNALKGAGPIVDTLSSISLHEHDERLQKVVSIFESNLNKMSGLQLAHGVFANKDKTDRIIPTLSEKVTIYIYCL